MIRLDETLDATGTCLQGYIEADYADLVSLFGEPNAENDGYKTDAEWIMETNEGIATIYNWKNGKNYLGEEGIEVEKITDWNIGGFTPKVVEIITATLKADKINE